MADLVQQVKNSTVNMQNMNPAFLRRRDLGVSKTVTTKQHAKSLQAFSNGAPVPYSSTLRHVVHEGDRGNGTPNLDATKPPGYIRNELGGMFTS